MECASKSNLKKGRLKISKACSNDILDDIVDIERSPSIVDEYKVYCESLKASCNYRILQDDIDGDAIDFSTNDYLNLSKNPEILHAAYKAGMKYGCGATGSRLLSGNRNIFCKFEEQIAHDKKAESAMIFCSGYQANLTVLSALCDKKIFDAAGKQVVLFFDKLNHESLYKAAQLSSAKLERYRHYDIEMLETLLKKYEDKKFVKFIVSETVFGMDGDFANLQMLINLSQKYNAFLYLDEAHATGVFGIHGYGLSTNFDLKNINCVVMGTFSKAAGVSGAYIACSKNIKDYLLQKCAGFIYSTALSPMIIGAARKSWKIIRKMDKERKMLLSLSEYFRKSISHNFDTMNSQTNIVPIRMQSSELAIRYKKYLLDQKIIVSALRQPTVSIPRLRIAITLAHSKKDIDNLLNVMSEPLTSW